MDERKMNAAIVRWLIQKLPWLAERDVTPDNVTVEITHDPGFSYSEYTYENASTIVVLRGEGIYYEWDLDVFWPDGNLKLGEFIAEVSALMESDGR